MVKGKKKSTDNKRLYFNGKGIKRVVLSLKIPSEQSSNKMLKRELATLHGP